MAHFEPNETVYCRFEAFSVLECDGSVASLRDGAGNTHRRIVGEISRDGGQAASPPAVAGENVTHALQISQRGAAANTPNLPAALAPEFAAAVGYAHAEKAAATRRAYGTDFRLFTAWCEDKGAGPLPALPETVAAYLAHGVKEGVKVSTLGRRVAAIRYAHKLASLPVPTDAEAVKATLRGIRRTIGATRTKKAPAVADRIKAMVRGCSDTLAGKRDRALILLGFAGAFRRSELVALDVEHLREGPEGLRVLIASSKTDQEGQGVTIAIARGAEACPVKALQEWLDAAGIEAGPIFRPINKSDVVGTARLTDQSVALIVKAHACRAGLDAKLFAAHSLRSGFLTSAAGRGASIFKMMDVSRHKSVDTLRGYVRDAELFKDHAGAGLL